LQLLLRLLLLAEQVLHWLLPRHHRPLPVLLLPLLPGRAGPSPSV
jgi:hypothetical protein